MLAALEAYFASKNKPVEGQAAVSVDSRLAPAAPAAKGSSRDRAPPVRVRSAASSPVPGPSGLPNLNLSSDEGEFPLGPESDSVGFDSDSDDLDDQGRPKSWDERLLGSAPAYQGLWTIDRKSRRRFLPIFLVSGYRVDFFPDDQTVRVAWHRYEVEKHLSLERSQAACEVLGRYAVQFSILGDTNFAEFVRGGEFIPLSRIAQTYKEMSGRAGVRQPRLPSQTRPLSTAASVPVPAPSVVPAASSKSDREGMTAYRIFKPFFDKHFPDWAKPRVPNLDLGSVLCDEEGNAKKPSTADDKDAVDFQISPGLQQFVDYGVQALQGVTDAKGMMVDPPKPLEKGSAIPFVITPSLTRYYRTLPHKPPVGAAISSKMTETARKSLSL